MYAKLIVFALACLLLAGCGARKQIIQDLVPKADDDDARSFIDLLRAGNYRMAQQMLAPSLRGDQAGAELQKLHELLDQGEKVDIEIIGFNSSTKLNSSSQDTYKNDLSYQVHFKHAWVVGDVLVGKENGATYVLGAHFHPIRDSLEVLNSFTLGGKSSLHYVVLAFSVLIPSFILYSLIICARTPVRRKWLWITFTLFGPVKFRFDWTTGLYDFKPISIVLFGSGAYQASPYAPWVFELALPIGALVFLLRRHKLIADSVKPPVRK